MSPRVIKPLEQRPVTLGTRNGVRLITTAAEIATAKEAGADEVGYMGRLVVLATLPHRRLPGVREFERRNGDVRLRLSATKEGVDLPYGTYPRLLLSWVTQEAVLKKSRVLYPGDTLADFLDALDLWRSGGPRGSITTLQRQFEMLYRAAFSWTYGSAGYELDKQHFLFDERELWWNAKTPEQRDFFKSSMTLSEKFYEELIKRPVPLNMVVLRELARERSPLALDIYAWLTYRMSTLHEETDITWSQLQLQFGSGYSRLDNFQAAFLEKLRRVLRLYREARAAPSPGGLTLWPSSTHVPPRAARLT